jgi:hypothetical protein
VLIRLKRLCVLTVGLMAFMTVMSVAPADATPNNGTPTRQVERADAFGEEVSPLARVPRCVTTRQRADFPSRYVDVVNHCVRTHRVKAIIAFGFDSPCHELSGLGVDGFTHTYGWAGRFDGLVFC